MRAENEIRERIQLAIVQELQNNLEAQKEPENYIPQFIERLTNQLHEIVLDEILFGGRHGKY